MTDYLRLIDTHTPGPRYDVTPLFADAAAFSSLVADLGARFDGLPFDLVAGIDALGFILGAGMALQAGKGFLAIRKGGKLPVPVTAQEFIDYTGQRKLLEVRADALKPGTRVLLVDEWIETGAQALAAITLIERQGGIVVGIAAINIDVNEHTRPLLEIYNCQSLWQDG